MSQVQAVVDTLKRVLKARGLTYRAIGEALELSEISVKRMFTSKAGAITLERLEAVCLLVGLDFADLLREHERARTHISRLTHPQETELVADLRLLLVAMLVRNGWDFADIRREYAFTEPETIHLLVRLDRIGLLELLPGNRVKIRVAKDFRWLPGGPIEAFFEASAQDEFVGGDFRGEDALRLYFSGPLTPQSVAIMKRKLQRVASEFVELQTADATLPLSERRNVGMLLALRPWELSKFDVFRRGADEDEPAGAVIQASDRSGLPDRRP